MLLFIRSFLWSFVYKFLRLLNIADDGIQVDGQLIKVFSERDPAALPWKELGIDLVIESTVSQPSSSDANSVTNPVAAGERDECVSQWPAANLASLPGCPITSIAAKSCSVAELSI